MSVSTLTSTADGGDFDRWEAELGPVDPRRPGRPARATDKAEAIRTSAGVRRHRKYEREV